MALSSADLADIDALLGAPVAFAEAFGGLRKRFPAMTITKCDPSDVDAETPFRVGPTVSLYLVSSVDHCSRLTLDAAEATGFVMAATTP